MKHSIHIAIFSVFIVPVVLFLVLRPREPSYQGKKPSEWLRELSNPRTIDDTAMAREAVLSIGSNAVPHLKSWIRYSEPTLKAKVLDLLEKQSLIRIDCPRGSSINAGAMKAFEILAPVDKCAKAELVGLLSDDRAIFRVMQSIGESRMPEAALVFIKLLDHQDWRVRGNAAASLEFIGREEPTAAPALAKCLRDENETVRANAASALWRIRQRPDLVVPALIERLTDTNRRVRLNSISALEQFQQQAKAAVPGLVKAL